jgi:AcrR family transcriptional regulator
MAPKHMTAVRDSSLRARALPRQRRSSERVEKILAATRVILREQGADRVTTVAVARKAGVSVGTFYRYFPSKKAVLIAIYEAYLARLLVVVDEFNGEKYRALGWREFFLELVRAVKQREMEAEEVHELANAIRAYPDLQVIDRVRGQGIVEFMVRHLKRLGAQGTQQHLERLGWFIYELNNGIWLYQTRSEISPAHLRRIVEWEATAIVAVVASVFAEDARASTRRLQSGKSV